MSDTATLARPSDRTASRGSSRTLRGHHGSGHESGLGSRQPAGIYSAAGPAVSLAAAIQAKVAVGQAGDPFEREADAVSDSVRAGKPVSRISSVTPGALQTFVQRATDDDVEPEELEEREDSAVTQTFVQRAATDDEEPEEPEEPVAQALVQRAATDDEEPDAESPVAQALVQRAATDEEEPEEPEPAVAQALVQRAANRDGAAQGRAPPAVAQALVQTCGSTSCSCSPAERARKEQPESGGDVVQMSPSGAGHATANADVSEAVGSSSGGEPLRPSIRGQLEESTGYDLGDVRVHQGGVAPGANAALRSRAFTHGRDVWLGAAESPVDLKLMAHESTHIVQQNGLRGGLQLIQRSSADYSHPEDGGNVRGRLDRRFADIDPDDAPDDNETRPVDRRELRARSGELGQETRPDVDRPAEETPRIDSAAATVEHEAQTPPDPVVPGQPTSAPAGPAEEAPGGAAVAAATMAAGAYAAADGQPEPSAEPEVEPPEPIAEPRGAAGQPLDPDPQADDQVASLAERAQSLREQGTLLRAQAAEAHANADIVRGNISKVSGEVTKAEEGISKSQQHTAYRREVIGQTDQALGISKEKQAKVAADAPGFKSKADEGKEDSGPMAGEARSLAAENASNAPDDEEAAARSREQGGKIDRVGNDSGTMDSAVTQTGAKAASLQEDAARASELNTQTQTNVTSSKGKLDEVSQRLTQHTTETGTARAQVTGLASAPAALHAQANSLDAAGQQVIASSFELETSLHDTQTTFSEQMASVPGIEPYDGPIPENADRSSSEAREAAEAGLLVEGFGETGAGPAETSTETPAEGASEGPVEAPAEAAAAGADEAVVQTLPDENAPQPSIPSAAAAPDSNAVPEPPAALAAPEPTAVPSAPTPAGRPAAVAAPTPALAGVLPSTAPAAPGGIEAEAGEAQPAPGEDTAAAEEPGEEQPGPAPGGEEAPVQEGAEGAGAGAADGEAEPLPDLESAPEPTDARRQIDVMGRLPGWLTGIRPESAQVQTQQSDEAAATRRAELRRINELAGGRMISELSAGQRLGIAGRLVLGRYADTVKGIKWPGWGGLARMLLDPRSMLTGAVGGLQMILSGGANLFSAAQWQRDPLGNLLKSAADIATGLAIILAAITGLAALVAAIMGALMIVTFGFAAPVALPVISVCTTIITTVGGWTIVVGKIALVLQALSLIKNLIDAATATTAEELQREAGEIQSDINGGAQAVMSIAGAKGSMSGIRNVNNRVGRIVQAARGAGGARGLARATASRAMARGGAALRTGGRAVARGAAAVGRGAARGVRAVGSGARAIGRGAISAGRRIARGVVSGGRRVGQALRNVGRRIRDRFRRRTDPRALVGRSQAARIAGESHTLTIRSVGNRIRLWLCTTCGEFLDQINDVMRRLPAQSGSVFRSARSLRRLANKLNRRLARGRLTPAEAEAQLRRLSDRLEAIGRQFPNERALQGVRLTYGANFFTKIRKHAQQMRELARREGFVIPLSPADPATVGQMQRFIQQVTRTGQTKFGRYMTIADAQWTKLGDAIVIRRANGEFLTFLDRRLGGQAAGWDLLP
jgi:hypothetical protein